jgi:hypothetical protein
MRHLSDWQHSSRSCNRLVFLVLFAFAVTSLTFAQENNNVRAVRISHVEGTAQLLDDSGVVFDQVHANMPVTEGMHIKTGSDGRVEVQFEDGSVARETPNSVISFDQLQRTSEGQTVTQIQAAAGLSYYEFNNRGGKYAVRFGPYTLSATKSSIFRVDVDQSPAQVAVMRGAVHIDTTNDGGLDVLTSQTATLDLNDAASYDVAQNLTADSWDQWNSDRDQLLAQMGARATMARALTGSPNDPGWSDLDYYGDWYDMPGYGMGWTPSGVGAGWDPFGSGYWGYYPAYGYTWISGNPWGWWPYHCGAWNFFNGPGWMWFPGNCGWGAFGNGWYPVTTVWNHPPNYVLPKRPITPVRGPVHMPPQQALIGVNRDPGKFQFRAVDGNRPVAAPIEYNGKTLHPIETSVHPRMAGPLGDSFSVASGYVPPAQAGPRSGAILQGPRTTYLPPSAGAPRNTIAPAMPRNTVAQPPRYSPPPTYHPAPSSGGMSGGAPHYSAPPMSAPPSAPHMSSPPPSAPSGGGSRPH